MPSDLPINTEPRGNPVPKRAKVVLLLLWLVTSIGEYGGLNAFWYNEFSTLHEERDIRMNRGASAVLAISGPVGFFPLAIITGFFADGWRP